MYIDICIYNHLKKVDAIVDWKDVILSPTLYNSLKSFFNSISYIVFIIDTINLDLTWQPN